MGNRTKRLLCWIAKASGVCALAETVQQCGIPRHEFLICWLPFARPDCNALETFEDVLGYCPTRRTSGPSCPLFVRYSDTERQQLSDYTCTALQLLTLQDVC